MLITRFKTPQPTIFILLVAFITGSILFLTNTTNLHSKNPREYSKILRWRHFLGRSDFEHIDGVRTYRNVCIEPNVGGASQFDRKITIYNAPFDGSIDLHMRIRPERQYWHFHSRIWPLTFTKKAIPKAHTFKDIHAYFVPYSRYGNLHHYLHDTAENLYATMDVVGDYKDSRLQIPEFHILAHTWDLDAGKHGAYANHLTFDKKKKFALIEEALGVTYNDVYTSVTPNTCYTLGVFGFDTSRLEPLAFENALRNRWDLTPDKCGRENDDTRPQVLLVRRRKRKISNMDQVQTAFDEQLKHVAKTVSVDFEDLSLKEQVQFASCSDVLIGMHGAGIDHHRFLKPHGALLVISFPPFPADYYKNDAKFKQQGYDTIKTCRAHISDERWKWYRAHVTNATEKEVFAYSEKMKHHNQINIWHDADCAVDIQELIGKTKKLLMDMNEIRGGSKIT